MNLALKFCKKNNYVVYLIREVKMRITDEISSVSILQDLQRLNQQINELLHEQQEQGWHKLNEKIPVLASNLDMQKLIARTPVKNPYYRQPFYVDGTKACLTLFVFKREDHDGAAVLLHTYGSLTPNGEIFSDDSASNLSKAKDATVHCTPIHNHTTHCHSYVAFMNGKVKIREKTYKYCEKKLILLSESERPAGSCVLDDSCGDYLHSIEVQFL